MTTTAEEVAEHVRQWVIGTNHPKGQDVLSKKSFGTQDAKSYNLKGLEPRKFLHWKEVTWGINVNWTGNASKETGQKVSRWFFTRQNNNGSPIEYGEVVAMGYGIHPSYFRWADRKVGMKMAWSGSPIFEWQILGGKKGQAVRTGDRVAIYNTRNNDFMTYFNRVAGGDIGYESSQTWFDQATDWLKKAVIKRAKAYLLDA